jgi:hypothetical protein
MKPIDIIRSSLTEKWIDEDGESWEITLLPGLTLEQIHAFETELGFTLPPDIRELLEYTNGLEGGPIAAVDFTSSSEYVGVCDDSDFAWKSLGIAADGYGNHWGYALDKNAKELGPIYYFCHDPPVFLYQSPDLTHFLQEMVKMCKHPHLSLIDDVHEDRLKEGWFDNPDLISVEDARASEDSLLSNFAHTLPDHWKLIDLRDPEIGAGCSWGRCEEFRRHPDAMVFGLLFKQPSRFSRWLRRLTQKKEQGSTT